MNGGLRLVARDANPRGHGVRGHALDVALASRDLADLETGCRGHALIRDGLQELADPDAAGVAGGAARR